MPTGLKAKLAAALTVMITAMSGLSAQAAPVCQVNGPLAKELNLPIYEWSDPTKPCKGTIVAVHGLTFYAAAYDDVATHLINNGYRFIAMDMRGFGRWRDEYKKFNGDDQVHFTQSQDDLTLLVQTLRNQDPNARIFAMGESLGANLALHMVTDHPELCDGIILGSPCYKTRIHPKPRWVVDFVKGAQHPNKKMNLTPYITPYLSNNRALTTDCLKDQRICRSLSPVELIKAEKTNAQGIANVDKLPAGFPVLVIAGAKDGVFKTSSLPELLKKFGTKDMSVNILSNKGHLLLEHQSVQPEIASLLDKWLTDQTTSAEVVQLVP
ncbi:MAG TPA: alpha/beta fold hydrolase [Trichormus sp.]|jgi:alpha-beta hydrolase superfamily lysophospholipase